MLFSSELQAHKEAFITSKGDNVSYGDLSALSFALQRIIAPGQLVLVEAINSTGSLSGYAALFEARCPVLLFGSIVVKSAFHQLIEKWRPAYVWMHHQSEAIAGKIALISFHDFSLYATSIAETATVHPEMAVVLTTSGSTGNSKLVRLSYQNIISNASSIVSFLSIQQNDRTITTLPPGYAYGLSVINTHLMAGASILVIQNSMMEKSFWDLLNQFRITNINGVPYHYKMMHKLQLHKIQLPSVRFFTQAGARLSIDLQSYFADICHKSQSQLFCMYGQTEATARMAYLPPELASVKLGSVGKAIPGGKIELIDDSGQPISVPNEVGELVYAGPNIAMGYALHFTDLRRGFDFATSHATGDYGSYDEDGYLYLVGRKDRMIKLHGKRINLDDFSNRIHELKPGWQIACVGKEDSISFFCTDATDLPEFNLLIQKEFNLPLSSYSIRMIPSIPVNESGKVLFHQLEN